MAPVPARQAGQRVQPPWGAVIVPLRPLVALGHGNDFQHAPRRRGARAVPRRRRAAVGAGVSAYLVEGLSAERLAPILEVALARFSHDDALRRRLADVERELGLGRADLVALAHLLGCDYTEGVAGVGVVNAVEILRAFAGAGGGDARLAAFRAWMDAPDERLAAAMGVTVDGEAAANDVVADFKRRHRRARTLWQVPASFPDPAVTAAFLDPRVDTSSARFVQVAPAADELRAWCERVFGWSADKAAGLLEPALKVRKSRRGGGATARRSTCAFRSVSPTTERQGSCWST